METDRLKFRSSINKKLKRWILFKGTLIALLGILFLIWSAIYLTTSKLSTWGPIIIFTGLGLIIYGLLPYRKLTYLEMHPNEIIVDRDLSIHVKLKGKLVFSIPHGRLKSLSYFERKNEYGIAIHLQPYDLEKIVIYDLGFNLLIFQKDSLRHYDCDLFLPYFSKKTYQRLISETGLE
jgi:hypothetical protein